MTVFNITKVVNKSLVNAIEKYMSNGKLYILYTDWGNSFGIRFKTRNGYKIHKIDKIKYKAVNKMLWRKLCSEPVSKFTSCPKFDMQNAHNVAQYGRYNNY